MTLLEPTALTVIRRDHENHLAIVARQKAGMQRHYEELERAYIGAVAALGNVLDHVTALDNNTVTEVTYGGLAFVHHREHWHDVQRQNADDRAAFDDMTAAYAHLRDAVTEYNIGAFEEAAQ